MKYLTLVMLIIGFNAFAEDLDIDYDLRYRFEQIEKEKKEAQTRQRIRARLSLKKAVNETLNLGMRIATGAGDPISTNQSLNGGFTNKPITLDLAYFDWTILGPLQISGGKVQNPFKSAGDNELIFDGDLTPEGLYLSYDLALNPFKIGFVASTFQVEENNPGKEVRLDGAQINFMHEYSAVNWTLGLGHYVYSNISGQKTLVDPLVSYGNTVDSTTDATTGSVTSQSYKYEYRLQQVFLTLGFDVGIPLALNAEFVKNGSVDEDNTGTNYSVFFGKAKDPGTFALGVTSRELEKDAVVGAFTDSNFGGGGTGTKGIELVAKYAYDKNTSVTLSSFDNESLDTNPKKYKRHQLDFSFKF